MDTLAQAALEVTPSDGTSISKTLGLYIGGGGDLVVTMNGVDITFVGVVTGSLLPIRVTKVKSTGTSATDIVALY